MQTLSPIDQKTSESMRLMIELYQNRIIVFYFYQ